MSNTDKIQMLNEAAREFNFDNFHDAVSRAGNVTISKITFKAMHLAQIACLAKAAENATVKSYEAPIFDYNDDLIGWKKGVIIVDPESITNPENLV